MSRRMFSAPFTSALNASLCSSHTHTYTLNTLTVVFSTADATRSTRVTLRHFHNLDSSNLRFVFKDIGDVEVGGA